MRLAVFPLVLSLALLSVCSYPPGPAEGFTVVDGLELTMWAAEPDLVNPTNIDIDERGRVWALEAVNYRRHLKDEPDLTDQGDTIVILEDTDGDGRADSRKVFDQNLDIRSPLGIAVLGDKVYISQSPNLTVYTKDDDDNIVSKKTMLTGWGGYDHDHGLHAITFGHDGRLYFNSGDQGFNYTDENGKQWVSSQEGPYLAGTALRMNPDGTDFSVLAHNFRNPYELAMDSFGTIWQTDNDDDGNQWTRVNYVMEGGNFGYWGPGGRRWREDHGSHFHHELPGVVPDIARTGPGSPTGVIVYEGTLLPRKYWGNMIHSEPGKRHIFAFLLEPDGAGYKMETETLVSSDDPYFRPSDVAVAPDGSVFIADWYDPVVGGHNMRDHDKGRIYRLAPPNHQASIPEPNLRSPNQATRFAAYQDLRGQGQSAVPALLEMWRQGDDVAKARALWLLAQTGAEGRPQLEEAFKHDDPRFRILGLRVARFIGEDIVDLLSPLLSDPDPGVRRECSLALQYVADDSAVAPLAELAKQYDGEDRWYLEALAIGAHDKEEALAARLTQDLAGDPRLLDLLWELQPANALPMLSRTARDNSLGEEVRLKALRAIGDRPARAAAVAVAGFVARGDSLAIREYALEKLSRQLFSQWIEFREDSSVVAAVRSALSTPGLQERSLQLAEDLGGTTYAEQVRTLAQSATASESVRTKALQALGQAGGPSDVDLLQQVASSGETALRVAAIKGLSLTHAQDLADRMISLLSAEGAPEVRNEAVRVLGRTEEGLNRILDLEEAGDLPAEVRMVATNLVHMSRDEGIRERAETVLPRPNKALPLNPRSISNKQGDPEKGRLVFNSREGAKCSTCHSLDPRMELAGPNLSAIGSKYDKVALLDEIMNPSAGIAPEYYVYILDTVQQGLVIGVVAEDTPEQVLVRNEFGDEIRLNPDEITSRRKSDLSMMPDDLVNSMTEQDLINLLEYLTTLRDGADAGD